MFACTYAVHCWIPGNWGMDGCKPSCGCWDSNQGSLKEERLLTSESPFQSHGFNQNFSKKRVIASMNQ